MVDLGVEHNLVEKSGSWYSFRGERIGQGRENAKQFLKENRDMYGVIDVELRKILGLTPGVEVVETPAPAHPPAAAAAGKSK